MNGHFRTIDPNYPIFAVYLVIRSLKNSAKVLTLKFNTFFGLNAHLKTYLVQENTSNGKINCIKVFSEFSEARTKTITYLYDFLIE